MSWTLISYANEEDRLAGRPSKIESYCNTCLDQPPDYPRWQWEWDPYGCVTSPILINSDDGPYALTGLEEPVLFDINATGSALLTTWTAPNARVAFLALDRNGNGTIDSGAELFGNHAPQPAGGSAEDGFAALAALDSNGDGVINQDDAVWPRLLLWTDLNHNGISEPEELQRVARSEIVALSFDAHWTGRRDVHGNVFRYEALYHTTHGTRPYYDVYFIAH